ncbi:MAG: calcium-binding protein [Nanoarchaeota archaeon]
MRKTFNKIVGVVANISLLIGTLVPLARPVPVHAVTVWNVGDVFAAVGGGSYNVYDNAGVFKETINDGLGGAFTTGCAFNNSLDKLYTTNFSNTKVAIYNDAIAHTPVTVVNTALQVPGGQSESVVFAANGDYYVGHPDGNDDILRYNSANVFQQAYNVPIESRGSDWMDLAADQTTMYYTSEGRKILRYDVGADVALADFGPGLPGAGIAFALRLLPPGDGSGGLLVADNVNVKQLDGAGNVVSTYDVTGVDGWFSLNIDPNGTHFWAGSFANGTFYKFLIEPVAGNYVDTQVVTVATGSNAFFGLCLKGEPTVAVDLCAKPTIKGAGMIVGTEGNDIILGSAGDDEIYGKGGDDIICARDGSDTVWAGDGNDTVLCEGGDDADCQGERGNDRIFGGLGHDFLYGGPDCDRVEGGEGDDNIDGGAGNDRPTDVVLGGCKDGGLFGQGGADTINGGLGGNDYIDGGLGNDPDLSGNTGRDVVLGGDGDDQLFGDQEADTLNGGAGKDTIWGSSGDDTINGGPGDDTMEGHDGNDTLTGDAGIDSADGGAEIDTCDAEFKLQCEL